MASVSRRSGHLVVDFRYRGIRCRERTGMADTPRNRRKLQRLVARMEAEILLKTFEYAHYFPTSPRVRQFRDIDLAIAGSTHPVPTFREFTQTWLSESAVA